MAHRTDIIVHKKKIARDVNLAGGKAINLAKLSLAGFYVPEFFVVSTDAFKNDKIDTQLKAKIADGLCFLKCSINSPIVARSSSPLEDHASHSFAGLYESYLNLYTLDDVVNAVELVWDSARKESVSDYSKKYDTGDGLSIAVVIQKMIRATVSGVFFTIHPIEDDYDNMLLEIVDGDCENLVSGKKSPIIIRIDKNSLSFQIDNHQKLSDDMQDFINSKDGLTKLLAQGLEIEKLLKSPQDIEWAFDGQQIWILQSRPISTVAQNNPAVVIDDSGEKWSSYFFAERFMQPLSPLGWSYLKPIIRKTALQDPLFFLGYDQKAKAVQLKLIDGLPFANLESYQKLYSHIPLPLISTDKKQCLELNSLTQKRIGFKSVRSIVGRLLFKDVGWCPPINLWQWRHFMNRMQEKTDKDFHKLLNKNVENYDKLFKESYKWSLSFLKIHRWSITFADLFSGLLKKYLTILKVDHAADFEKLLGSLPANATVEANIALLKLDVLKKESLEQFIAQFGHRSESLDIACTTWGEDSDRIFKMSESLKRFEKEFLENQKRNLYDRQQAKRELRSTISKRFPVSGKILILLFELLLYYTQQFAMLRENQRNLWHKILRIARFSSLGLGKEFEKAGIINEKNDVFYLTRQNISEIVKNHDLFPNAKKMIEYRKNNQSSLIRKTKSSESNGIATEKKEDTLNGIGVSAGKIQGRVRIAANYTEAMQGERGDILVVPSADPAWSPIFGVISGLVMERGGVLSHASIVAREFRLPTITSVFNATQKLRNGELVEIDGKQGVLRVISE